MLGSSWHIPPRGRGAVSGDPGGGATIVYTTYTICAAYKSTVGGSDEDLVLQLYTGETFLVVL